MDKKTSEISEIVASQYALEFLREYTGDELFLGSDIEQLLAERSIVIYQDVRDPEYYGASICYKDKHFIAINTRQPLRSRYYSAAHELWHLLHNSGKLPIADTIENFDHERAADHFAACLMLPERLVMNLINTNKGSVESLIFKISDLSSMPYVAVVRKLQELGKKIRKELSERSEADWVNQRNRIGLLPSVLDKMDNFTKFTALTNKVSEQQEDGQITLELAANILKHADPEEAERYWLEREKINDDWLEDD